MLTLALAKWVIMSHTQLPIDVPEPPIQPDLRHTADIYAVLSEMQSLNKQIADEFLLYRSKDYIKPISEEDLYLLDGVDTKAVSFIRSPNDHDPFYWVIIAIHTNYGQVYFSTVLNEHGAVPNNTSGVLISYETSSTTQILYGAAAEHPERFPNHPFSYAASIQHLDELHFYLGDDNHPFTIAKYM